MPMKRFLPYLFATAAFLAPEDTIFAQSAPVKRWDKTFWGNSRGYLHNLIQTSDRGYILGGGSMYGLNGDKSQASKGKDNSTKWEGWKSSGDKICVANRLLAVERNDIA